MNPPSLTAVLAEPILGEMDGCNPWKLVPLLSAVFSLNSFELNEKSGFSPQQLVELDDKSGCLYNL